MKKIIFISFFVLSSMQASYTYNNISYSSGLLSFGNYHYRTNVGSNLKILSLNAPSFSAGCGGIDIGLGGISFIRFDELINNLKAIMKNAGGYAFKLALSTFCKQCESILNDLQGIADAINSLNMDSCAAAERLTNYAAEKLGFDQQNGGGSFSGAMRTYVSDAREQITQWVNVLNGNDDKLFSGIGSLVYETFKNNGFLFDQSKNKENTRAFMVALIGDVIGSLDKENKNVVVSQAPQETIEKIIENIISIDKIGEIKKVRIFDKLNNQTEIIYKDVELNYDIFKYNGIPLDEYYYNKISDIVTKVYDKQDINLDEYEILAKAPFELITAINTFTIAKQKGKIIDTEIKNTAKYYAAILTLSYLNNVLDYANKNFVLVKTRKDKPISEDMKMHIENKSLIINDFQIKIQDKISAKLFDINKTAQIINKSIEEDLKKLKQEILHGINNKD